MHKIIHTTDIPCFSLVPYGNIREYRHFPGSGLCDKWSNALILHSKCCDCVYAKLMDITPHPAGGESLPAVNLINQAFVGINIYIFWMRVILQESLKRKLQIVYVLINKTSLPIY